MSKILVSLSEYNALKKKLEEAQTPLQRVSLIPRKEEEINDEIILKKENDRRRADLQPPPQQPMEEEEEDKMKTDEDMDFAFLPTSSLRQKGKRLYHQLVTHPDSVLKDGVLYHGQERIGHPYVLLSELLIPEAKRKASVKLLSKLFPTKKAKKKVKEERRPQWKENLM